ncbi:hypothetical protein TrCOL_g4418 [Triparma columacea]|uniref:dCMP deaminase n=1 Tax=Triparma columacea TaxID=722753 RepID=A0A9W7G811_9STRA|nr:hypothetical protein TrCOL_g4418 [Triparma columacea]
MSNCCEGCSPESVKGKGSGNALERRDTFERPLSRNSPSSGAFMPPAKKSKGNLGSEGDDKENASTSSSAATSAATSAAGPRSDYLSWDDYFTSVAFLSAMRSKDPSTQVGACIVNSSNRIVGIGYNGFPAGCPDDALPWSRVGPMLETKYPYVCHAEVNAILNKCSADVRGARIYVALFPCNECAKMIIQSGIKEVVYLSDKYHDSDQCKASRKMFGMSGVKCRRHVPEKKRIVIEFPDVEKEVEEDRKRVREEGVEEEGK